MAMTAMSLAACADDPDTPCGRECVPPLECVPRSIVDGVYVCEDPTEPTCTGWPAGQRVPFTTTTGAPEGTTVHWAPSNACITTSYDDSAADLADTFAASTAAWNEALACSSTHCLAAPVPMAALPSVLSGERRIHLTRGLMHDEPNVTAVPNVHRDARTGHVRMVHLEVADHADDITLPDLLFLIGAGLGLGATEDGSVMVPIAGRDGLSAPTAHDVEAVCTLYGVPRYCGEVMP